MDEERQARKALLKAEMAFRKARAVETTPPLHRLGWDGKPKLMPPGLAAAAADLIEAVRLATADFDPMRRPDLKAYVKELRAAAKAIRAAAEARGGGERSKRYVAVERLLKLASDILKGSREMIPDADNKRGWRWGPLVGSSVAEEWSGPNLSRPQLAALAVSEMLSDVLPEAPRKSLRAPERQRLVESVSKEPRPQDILLQVARAHGFTKDAAHGLLKFEKRKK